MTGDTTPPRHDQLRLALIELGRIEREIRELEPRVREHADRELLRSLRMCRAALLKVAYGRLLDAAPTM